MNQTMTSPGAQAGRIQWIDITKAMAAWMVVTSHLLRQGVLTDLLAAFSVSLFFVLAGMTLHPHKDRLQFMQRLLQRVVLPYLAAGLISIAVYRILGNYAAQRLGAASVTTTLAEDLRHLLYGSSVGGRMKWNESLWFLPCYCLMILMAECITRLRQIHYLLPLAFYVAGGAAGYRMIQAGMTGLPWHLETALLVLPLCGFGQYVGIGLMAMRTRPAMAILVGAAMFCSGLQMFPAAEAGAGGSLSLRAVHIGGAYETYWFLLATSVGAIYLIWYLARRRPVAAAPYVGAHSLEIVLWNKFPVLFLQVIVPVMVPGFDTLFIGGTDMSAVLMAAILAIPCMAVCLVWAGCYTAVLRRSMSRYRRQL